MVKSLYKLLVPDLGQVTIQSDFFFNKDLEYLRYDRKGSRPVLSISKMKAAYYPNVGLEQMVPDQMWIKEECKYDITTMYGFKYKYDYTVIDSPRAVTFRDRYGVQMIMRFNEIHKFNDGTLHQIDEALDYRVKEFKVAVCSSLRSLKPKCTIESRAKRSSKIISLGYYSIILASSHIVKRDENPICTLGDYSKPRHEGYKNTIELHVGNNVKQSESYEEKAKENEEEEKDSLENIHVNSSLPPDPSAAFNTKKGGDGEVMFIELIRKNDDSSDGEPEEEGSTTTKEVGSEYFDIFLTRSELAYHKYLICSLIPLIFLRNPIIMEGFLSNLKIPCNIRRRLDPGENLNRGVSNFTGRIKGRHVFIGNFTYIVGFMIGKDISLIIDPRLSQVVLGKPFVEISNMTHAPPEGVVRFTNRTDEVAYKMPHMIE
uniref:MAK10-like protein n=1 Tax=Tanacetum cinerariifolium TaxID=118510 RepID=A0A6L2KS04_TANCI|nr:MAK10-like protein [Tanacetum cinerariifolium]